MNWSHTGAAGLEASHGTDHPQGRLDRILVALILATVLAGLSAIYFGVNAGVDFPEPWSQMTD